MPSLSALFFFAFLDLWPDLGLLSTFGHFVAFGTLFLALLLGLPTVWDVSLHLLPIGCTTNFRHFLQEKLLQ